MLQDNYLTENSDSNEKEETCSLKQNVKTPEVENAFLRNDLVSKQNLMDSLLEHNSNLLNRQCCLVIQDTQSNVPSDINTDVTDNHSNNHGVNTITNKKVNKQTTFNEKSNETIIHKDNDDSNLIKRQSTNRLAVKKDVFILGDSMIEYVNEREFLAIIQWKWEVIVEQQQMTLLIMSDPLFEKNQIWWLLINTGTDDIQNNVNTVQKTRKVISSIKEYDTDDSIKIGLSNIIHRSDHDFEDKINETNRKLDNLCKGKGMSFINNSSIDNTCFNRSKLHLNKCGTSLLIRNFSKAVKSDW